MSASPSLRINPTNFKVSFTPGDILKSCEPHRKLDLLAKIAIELKKEYTKVFDALFEGNRLFSMGLRNKSRRLAANALIGVTIKDCVALADGSLALETSEGQVFVLYGGASGIGAGRMDSIEEAADRARFACTTEKFTKEVPDSTSKLELEDALAFEAARVKLGINYPEAF